MGTTEKILATSLSTDSTVLRLNYFLGHKVVGPKKKNESLLFLHTFNKCNLREIMNILINLFLRLGVILHDFC